MPQPIALRPEMGREVLRHLSKFAELPTKGILAGQAVDSALTDLWGGGGGVYNDLDVFRQCPTAAYKPHEKANGTAMRSHLDLSRRQTYSGMALVMETVDTYGIASVSRKGMLNYVNCVMASGRYHHRLTPAMVLAGFDLNCVRVAVNLETGLLHWDSHYEAFQASRQLKIAMMHTPYHTYLRLAKKLSELPNVYADLPLAAQACAAIANSRVIRTMLKDRDISLMFGQKHLELAQSQSGAWADYFSLEQSDFRRGSRSQWEQATGVPQGTPLPEDVTRLWALRPRGDVDLAIQARVNKLGKAGLFFASRVVEEACRRKKNQVYVKLDTLREHRMASVRTAGIEPLRDVVLQHLDLLGTCYVEGQALPSVSDKVDAFFKKHTKFSGMLFGLTLAQQWQTVQRLQRLVKRFCSEVLLVDSEAPWGVLETQATPEDLQSDERAWALLVSDHDRQNKPFDVTPLPLPALPTQWANDYVVKELLTPLELTCEGADMGHCVGGYSQAVRSGRSRIVRIRHKHNSKGWSTVELRPARERGKAEQRWAIVQHRARFNREPNKANHDILRYLLAGLNLSETAREHWLKGTLVAWAQSKVQAQHALVQGLLSAHANLSKPSKHMDGRLRRAQAELEQAKADLKTATQLQMAEESTAPAG